MYLPVFRISDARSPTVCDVLHLASSLQLDVFNFRPCCSIYQDLFMTSNNTLNITYAFFILG